ncbi:MAG: murein L,D-transpeptidase YafK [Motiliproteus sp.]|jgi:murein L,D-transpeptidase YafK
MVNSKNLGGYQRLMKWTPLFSIGMFLIAFPFTTSISYAVSLSTVEGDFLAAIEDIDQNRLEEAMERLLAITQHTPEFKLAQVIFADLVSAQANPIESFAAAVPIRSSLVEELRQEAVVRGQYRTQKPKNGSIPKSLVKMADGQSHAIVVDLSKSRLYLFENKSGKPVLVKDFYASSGSEGAEKFISGDKKTPVGVYFVTTRLAAKNLPDKYGSGALPLNYPNALDAQQQKTGNGIWLHGSPTDTYSRAPLASEGCVSLTNYDFAQLDSIIDIHSTPVIIGENIEWLTESDWLAQQQPFSQLVNDWKKSWESLDTQDYLSNYSHDFDNGREDYIAWSAKKIRINKAKSYVNIDLKNLSFFSYPGQGNILVVTFKQHYMSNNFNGKDTKRQYWKKEGDKWRIIFEGAPSSGKI